MNDQRDLDEHELEKLPKWVNNYLSCWGSRKRPDGGRMTVTFAADFAGVGPTAVRNMRQRSPAFRRLEIIARHMGAYWSQSFVEAGLRGLSPKIMQAFADLIEERHPQTVIKGLELLMGKVQELEVTWRDALPPGVTAEQAAEAQRQFAAMLAEQARQVEDEND